LPDAVAPKIAITWPTPPRGRYATAATSAVPRSVCDVAASIRTGTSAPSGAGGENSTV